MDSNHEEVNSFDHLPDNLLLLIFDKILDLEAKALVSCFLVSKRFASLIPQTNTNTVLIEMEAPANIPQSKKSRGTSRSLFKNILSKLSSKSKPRYLVQREIRGSDVLKIFREIKCLKIQSHSAGVKNPFAAGFLMWKAFFGAKFRYCLFLFAPFVHKGNDNDPIKNSIMHRNDKEGEEVFQFLWTFGGFHLQEALQRHRYVKDTISDNHCILKKVVVCDSENRGKVCMGEEDIAECRRSWHLDNDTKDTSTTTLYYNCKMWYVPVLDLPMHGCTMKGATLLWVYPASVPMSKEKDVLKGFEDDEEEKWGIFNEAVREIVHNNNIDKRMFHTTSFS